MSSKRLLGKSLALFLAGACIVGITPQDVSAKNAATSLNTKERSMVFTKAEETEHAEIDEGESAGSRKSAPSVYTAGQTAGGTLYPNGKLVYNSDVEWDYEYKQFEEIDGEMVYYERDFYVFTPEKSGRYTLTTQDSTGTDSMYYSVYDNPDYNSDTTTIHWKSDKRTGKNAVNSIDLVAQNTYYLEAYAGYCPVEQGETMDYTFRFELDGNMLVPGEPIPVEFDKKYKYTRCGTFGSDITVYPTGLDGSNVFTFEVPTSGCLTIDTVCPEWNDPMYDIPGISWWLSDSLKGDNWLFSLTGEESGYYGTHQNKIDLIAGSYAMFVCGGQVDEDFSFKMSFDPIVVASTEKSAFDTNMKGTNNTFEYAASIDIDQKYVAQSVYNDNNRSVEHDWYKFTLKKPTELYFSASSTRIDRMRITLSTAMQYSTTVIPTEPFPYETGVLAGAPIQAIPVLKTGDSFDGKKVSTFEPDTYYLCIEKYREAEDPRSAGNTGEYRFEISTGSEVSAPLESVEIYDSTLQKRVNNISVGLDKTRALEARILPQNASDKTVAWKSDDPSVATVSESGVVTGVTEGVCTITVTTNGVNSQGKQLTASCQVTVDKNAADPDPEPDPEIDYTIKVGKKKNIKASGKIYDVEVTEKGIVKCKAKGKKLTIKGKKPGVVGVVAFDKYDNTVGIWIIKVDPK